MENEKLTRSNNQFKQISVNNNGQNVVVDQRTEELGRKITGLDFAFNSMSGGEFSYQNAEDKLGLSM